MGKIATEVMVEALESAGAKRSYSIFGEAPGYRAALDCDVLLQLCTDFAWPQFYPDKARIIRVDLDPIHIGRCHPVDIGVVGSIWATLDALLTRLSEHNDDSFLTKYTERYRKLRDTEAEESPAGPDASIVGSYLTKLIDRHAPDNALFAAEDGTPLAWMLRHVEIRGTRRTFGSQRHGIMASGMPSTLGLKACAPERPAIVLAGDGGYPC